MTLLSAILPPPAPRPVKAESGIGAYWMTWDPQLGDVRRDTHRILKEAQVVGRSNLWVRSAERVIGDRFATIPWHLEDGDGTRIGENEGENDSPPYLAVLRTVERPYIPQKGEPIVGTPRTRSALWKTTGRHMGLCNVGFHYLDRQDAFGGAALQTLYINPARMTPATDDNGNLTGWVLDADQRGRGMPLTLDQVVPFYLDQPEDGWFGSGLVEAAISKVTIGRLADRHASGVLASGGRLAGVLSAKGEDAIPDDQFQQLVRDMRNIVDGGDAAKRTLILKGPIEFTKMAADPSELDLSALMEMSSDALLALWGVPRSQLGMTGPAGLNSGESKGFDEAVLWQNAVGPRLRTFAETFQFQVLDRWAELGLTVTLVIEEPEFDDETPMFDRAQKAIDQPLKNIERRGILGLDPFGDERDDEVWVSATMSRIYPEAPKNPTPPRLAPFTGQTPPPPTPEMPEDEPPLPDDGEQKARVPGIRAVRGEETRDLERNIAGALATVGRQLAARVRRQADHLRQRPNDTSSWWDESMVEDALERVLLPHVEAIANRTGTTVASAMGKAGIVDAILPRLLRTAGDRIKDISATTRDRVQRLITQGIADGLGAAELGDLVERDGGFDELRAETIARTETARVLNEASLESFREFGVDRVRAVDGDDDETCADRNGRVYSVEEAMSIEDHPNGTLSWEPLVAA